MTYPYIGQTLLSDCYFSRYNKKQYQHYPRTNGLPQVPKKVEKMDLQSTLIIVLVIQKYCIDLCDHFVKRFLLP